MELATFLTELATFFFNAIGNILTQLATVDASSYIFAQLATFVIIKHLKKSFHSIMSNII